jgi:RNA polymerase sigma-70 factor, ECF subfamily
LQSTESDVNLLQAVARGEEIAVETLYRTHCDAILRFVYRRASHSFEDAQEITQDTFLTAIKLAASYRGDSSAYIWLCGIARLRLIDYFRKGNRERVIPREMTLRLDEALHVSDDLRQGLEVSDAVEHLMAVLSDDEREAMMLRYVEELSIREISQLLGRSEKGVENLLLRAKQKQRQALNGRRVGT